jgi:hypothetical protein
MITNLPESLLTFTTSIWPDANGAHGEFTKISEAGGSAIRPFAVRTNNHDPVKANVRRDSDQEKL